MKRLVACALLFTAIAPAELTAQGLASPARPQPRTSPAEGRSDEKDTIRKAMGEPPQGPITTEIYAEEAFFDSNSQIGIFSGRVIVNDPRFNVQADKLTIYLSKRDQARDGSAPAETAQRQGLEKAVAEGNVGVVREAPGEKGGPPVRSVGRAEMAVYTSSDGKVELRGTPRVQSGINTHVATSPDTVMVLDQSGQLITKGPSRTEIRQEGKELASPGQPPAATPKP